MKKKYYKLTAAIEPKLIGVRDGSAQAEVVRGQFLDTDNFDLYYKYFLSHGQESFSNRSTFPEFDFTLEYVKLRKGAFVTNFIYFSPAIAHRFLVDEKIQGILNDFNLPPFKMYDAKIYGKNEFTDEYKFLFSPSLGFEYVNFNKCLFSNEFDRGKDKFIKIRSGAEFITIEFPVRRDKIVLTSDFDSELDFFNLLIYPDPIISGELRDEFIRQSVTGIIMTELDDSQFEIE